MAERMRKPLDQGRRIEVNESEESTRRIRDVLGEYARLPVAIATLSDDDNLFHAGMTSHASVNVMLALEDAFDVEFPESMLRKSTFSSIGALRRALDAIDNAGLPPIAEEAKERV